MKKSDLKTGMRVKTRSGKIYLVIKDVDTMFYGHQDIAFINNNSFSCGSDYTEDLKDNSNSNYDIVEVFQINHDEKSLLTDTFLDLDKRFSIWKRQEFTDRQKEIFKALKVLGFNWIARDKDNPVIAFDIKPDRRSICWYTTNCKQAELFTKNTQEKFDFVKWEDEEPFEIPSF